MIAAVQELALRVILILLAFEILSGLFFHFVSRNAKALPPATGPEGLVGRKAVVRREFEPDPDGRWIGKVALGAELWHAVLDADRAGSGEGGRDGRPPDPSRGDEVEVAAIEGLTLRVRVRPGRSQ